MNRSNPITQKTVDDIGILFALLDNLKLTRKRFVRSPHKRYCACLLEIPSTEKIAKQYVEIKSLRDLVILVIKLQVYASLPTMAELIRNKIAEHISILESLQKDFLRQAVLHEIKSTSKFTSNYRSILI